MIFLWFKIKHLEDNYYFEKFCNILSDEIILKTSTAYGVSWELKKLLKEIKSQVHKALFTLQGNRDDYLDYLINEVEKQEYVKEIYFKHIQRWLDEYEITLEELEYLDFNKPISKVLGCHYNDMIPFSKEKDKAFLLQSDFLGYYCLKYANQLIAFLNSKKNKSSIKENIISNTRVKPFKDEYLNAFCKEIQDDRVIKENSFLQLYDNGITHYTPYLESEITENLLLLDNDKKEAYLEFVFDKVSKTPFATIPTGFIDKWMLKYNTDIKEFPKFSNKDLNAILNKNYSGYWRDPKLQEVILDIQTDFFCYASMLEVEKVCKIIDNKSTSTAGKKNSEQLTANQIVLLLQEIGFFTHPKIEDAAKINQAKLISEITGLNDKNIKNHIEKLDKDHKTLGDNYNKDMVKINNIFNSME